MPRCPQRLNSSRARPRGGTAADGLKGPCWCPHWTPSYVQDHLTPDAAREVSPVFQYGSHTQKSAMSKIPTGTLQAETALSMDISTFTFKLQRDSSYIPAFGTLPMLLVCPGLFILISEGPVSREAPCILQLLRLRMCPRKGSCAEKRLDHEGI